MFNSDVIGRFSHGVGEVSALILISCLNDGPKSTIPKCGWAPAIKINPVIKIKLHLQNCCIGTLLQESSGDVTVWSEEGWLCDTVFPKDSFGGKQQNQV